MINSPLTVNFCILVKPQYCICLSLILINPSCFHGPEKPRGGWQAGLVGSLEATSPTGRVACQRPFGSGTLHVQNVECWPFHNQRPSTLQWDTLNLRLSDSDDCHVWIMCRHKDVAHFSPHVHALQLAEGILVRQDRALTVEKPVRLLWQVSVGGLCKPAGSHLHQHCAVLNQEP